MGNAASEQSQLDVYGDVIDVLYQATRIGVAGQDASPRRLIFALLDYLEIDWKQPDEGIWEVRGASQHFTHSKVMAWVAFDRTVRGLQEYGDEHDAERIAQWSTIRDEIHAEVCAKAYDEDRKTFVQAYGSAELDAALLLMPLVGFLPATDERIRGTVDAIAPPPNSDHSSGPPLWRDHRLARPFVSDCQRQERERLRGRRAARFHPLQSLRENRPLLFSVGPPGPDHTRSP